MYLICKICVEADIIIFGSFIFCLSKTSTTYLIFSLASLLLILFLCQCSFVTHSVISSVSLHLMCLLLSIPFCLSVVHISIWAYIVHVFVYNKFVFMFFYSFTFYNSNLSICMCLVRTYMGLYIKLLLPYRLLIFFLILFLAIWLLLVVDLEFYFSIYVFCCWVPVYLL